MRSTVAALVPMFALLALAGSASAAPSLPPDRAIAASPLTLARDGCGAGWHAYAWRDRWGNPHRKCVPNRG